MQARRRNGRRLAVTLIALFAVVVVFGIRLVDIQVVQAQELSAAAANNRNITSTVYGARGEIVDANGVVLADSVNRYDITASPVASLGKGNAASRDTDIQKLAQTIGMTEAAVRALLDKDPTSQYVLLAKKMTLDVRNAVVALGISWVYPRLDPARTYPNGSVAGNLVGYLGTDGPLAGLEYSENQCIAAQNGTETYERSADSVRLPGSTVTTKAAVDGGTLRLTIDSDLQYFTQQAIAAQAKKLKAKWATAVIVRVKDGHIMAAADYPSIDPNDVQSTIDEYGLGALTSGVFTRTYEPGSTFKVIAASALLNEGKATQTTPVVVPPSLKVPGGTISDVTYHPTMHWTTTGVLVNSSNIGISQLSKKLSAEKRYGYLRAFGIGSKTAVGFNGEASGLLKNYQDWDGLTNFTTSFGQGLAVTSAQVASVYQTLGNGGVRMPLTLVEGCQQADGTVTDTPSTTGTRVVTKDTARKVVDMMENVVTQGGLSSTLTVKGYDIAAKTGTAQVARNGVYTSDRVISVAGLVPGDDPEYAVVVTFGEPTTIRLSSGAAPTFTDIMNQLIKTYRIAPSTHKVPNLPATW